MTYCPGNPEVDTLVSEAYFCAGVAFGLHESALQSWDLHLNRPTLGTSVNIEAKDHLGVAENNHSNKYLYIHIDVTKSLTSYLSSGWNKVLHQY